LAFAVQKLPSSRVREIIADNLKEAGWYTGSISSTDHEGRQFWVVAAHRSTRAFDEYVGRLPQMRLRNPKRDPSKPFVYIGLTRFRVERRFAYCKATPKTEWRAQQYGVRSCLSF
jgi:hypothetical protein